MTEKELIEIEIAHLQGQIKEKQKKLKELSQTKSPVEEAFKKNYGVYPNELKTDNDLHSWQGFQAGYNAAYEEKVSEEPEEKPKEPKTLEQMLDGEKYFPDRCDTMCGIVEKWMSQFHPHDMSFGNLTYCNGFFDAIEALRSKLR